MKWWTTCLSLGLSLAVAVVLCLTPASVSALVKHDEGSRVIEGVQLLQDANDDTVFYYLPQFPSLAKKPDGETLEFLCVKYVGNENVANGGLFHALIEFRLSPELEALVVKGLKKQVPGAELRGPVPLLEAVQDGQEGVGGFSIVSGTLADTEEGGFTRSVISSGRAPLTPGSKAAVAARLSAEGATLFFDSLAGPTSDISIAITAYYEALVKGYNARVTVDTELIYNHFSVIANKQKNFSKQQLRNISDELIRSGDLKVEVIDRSQTIDMDSEAMKGLLDIITTKVTDLMFDMDSGWSAAPEKEQAVENNQLKGKLETGTLRKFFVGEDDKTYATDNQFVLKNRTDIQRNSFSFNLNQSTAIRVPVNTSGNLSGIYEELKNDPRYFRTVNLEDPSFERRSIQFQIDADYIDSFQDTVNFVSVNFRKTYPDQPTVTKSLVFSHEDVVNGRTMQELSFPRLGLTEANWGNYEYQVRWSVRDRPTVGVPANEDQWTSSKDPAISLIPPFVKRVVEVEIDLFSLEEMGVKTAVLEFATPLAGKPKLVRKATIRPNDAESVRSVAVYADRDQPIGWRVTWHTVYGPIESKPQGLTSDFLFLVPPDPPADEESE